MTSHETRPRPGADSTKTRAASARRPAALGSAVPAGVALSVVLLLIGGPPSRAQNIPLPAQESVPVKVAVDLVLLHVTVSDRSGRPFRGLKAENFRLYDNEVEQTVPHFSTEDLPFTMGLVLDRSGSMAAVIDDVYRAAFHTIRASKPEDEFFVFTFNDEIQLRQDFSKDQQLLEKRLKGVVAQGRTALWDAVLAAVEHSHRGTYDKKALLVVTDGDDNSSEHTFREMLELMRQENVAVYVVGFFGMGDDNAPRIGEEGLRSQLIQLAEATGGRAYFPRTMKECEEVCIAEELRQQYALGYYPQPKLVRDGSWHAVQVQLRLPAGLYGQGLTARARAGYFAPRE